MYTGNDLAIDMVIYGSDYLLGLSAFAPEAFGLRDRLWAAGDPRFYALNDVLQYLGAFAFRDPVPAYKHSAAQFLHLRGQIPTTATHPASPTRPDSDLPILAGIVERLDAAMAEAPRRGTRRVIASPPVPLPCEERGNPTLLPSPRRGGVRRGVSGSSEGDEP